MELNVKKNISISGLLGKLLLVIMVPLLIMNCYLLFKSYRNPDIPPQIAGITPLIVQSGSMDDGKADSIKVGDLVLVNSKEKGETFKTGDIITYKLNDEYITHEIIAVNQADGKQVYQTKGRANNIADQEYVQSSQILGKSTVTIPKLGDVLLFLQTPIGLISVIGIPLILFLGYDKIRTLLTGKKEENKDEETKQG